MIYLEKPEEFKSKFEVVSCFLEYSGKFLILHRQDFKPQGDTWGVPAGKIEGGENAKMAMVRELREETGYEANEKDLLFLNTVYVRYPDYDFVYHIFKLQIKSIFEVKIDSKSHKDFEWVNPKEALSKNLITDLNECIKLCYKI